MPANLAQIVAATRRGLAESRARADLLELEKKAEIHVPRGFRRALTSRSGTGPAVIAELKKASPSRGMIRADFDPEILAKELEEAGATALSVLTDAEFFQGSLRNLQLASAKVTLPCLRKDFIVDEFQIVEARANGADAILLIVAALTQEELLGLAKSAKDWGLDVLCEVHDRDQLQRAMDAECDLIGVNSRDLRTFKVDLETALRLGEQIPDNVVRVAESGIHDGADIARLKAAGYDAFLIGESLMKAASPGQALRKLRAEAGSETGSKS
jgi:indole-3-glycerol phosphate synthase